MYGRERTVSTGRGSGVDGRPSEKRDDATARNYEAWWKTMGAQGWRELCHESLVWLRRRCEKIPTTFSSGRCTVSVLKSFLSVKKTCWFSRYHVRTGLVFMAHASAILTSSSDRAQGAGYHRGSLTLAHVREKMACQSIIQVIDISNSRQRVDGSTVVSFIQWATHFAFLVPTCG